MIDLNSNLDVVKGAGSATREKLSRLGIESVRDLLMHVPFRYEDYSNVSVVKGLKPGPVTLKGKFKSIKARHGRKGGLHITQAVFDDGTGGVEITWFNQPYRAKALNSNSEYYISGEYAFSRDRFGIINPDVERAAAFTTNTARIRGIYPETRGLRSATIRKLVYEAMKLVEWDEDLPHRILDQHSLPPMNDMLRQVHFPSSMDKLSYARRRLEFNEMFDLILAAQLLRNNLLKLNAREITLHSDSLKQFTASLPFTLTDAQRKAAWSIVQDMSSSQPMNRLVQGDVGSGKTVVAAIAARNVVEDGGQVAIVAPTVIVARQHAETFNELFSDKIPLLISSTPSRTKSVIKRQLKDGEIKLVIGTHALLQLDVEFKQLDLLVIDEQHRYGVKQRSELAHKDKIVPHVLTMTATPIPRTLALSIYSDLDVSVIDELPPGRKPVSTRVYGPGKRAYAYDNLAQELNKGHQAYVVCPLIDESDVLGVTSVAQEVKRITKAFKNRTIASLHGSLKPDEKETIVKNFEAGHIDILVSTTVVEVGVNVPNATFMLIEGAERFGLAQLHQLRGRVGRASDQAYCMAITTSAGQGRQRLAAFESTTDGFKIAELDLQLRGGGQLLGTMQSGAISFKHASLTNTKLVAEAREAVELFLAEYDLLQYPLLNSRVEQYKSMKRLN